jgi:hypothetical protein
MKINSFQIKNKSKGFTFIEIILYVALLTMLLTVLTSLIINTVRARAANYAQINLSSQIRFANERIKYEIRNGAGLSAGASFNRNLALQSNNGSYALILLPQNGAGVTRISVVNGAIAIQRDNGPWVALTGPDITVTNLTFVNNSGPAARTKNISFTIGMTINASGSRRELTYSTITTTSAEVRVEN